MSGITPVTSGVGVTLWGGAEYQHPLGRRSRLRVGADASRWEYRHSRFDKSFVSLNLGPRWLLDGRTEASLLANAQQLWIGDAPSHRDVGARLEMAYRASPRTTMLARVSWHGRRYRSRSDLDGPVLGAGLSLRWAVAPTVRVDLSGGYGWERPRDLSYRNRNLRLGAGVSVDLPRGFTLGGGVEIRWTRYRGDWGLTTRDGSPRRDRATGLRASVHNRGFTLGGFSPELALARETRTSNSRLYDYKRLRGELRFVRQF